MLIFSRRGMMTLAWARTPLLSHWRPMQGAYFMKHRCGEFITDDTRLPRPAIPEEAYLVRSPQARRSELIALSSRDASPHAYRREDAGGGLLSTHDVPDHGLFSPASTRNRRLNERRAGDAADSPPARLFRRPDGWVSPVCFRRPAQPPQHTSSSAGRFSDAPPGARWSHRRAGLMSRASLSR